MDIQTRPFQKGDEKSLSKILKKIYHKEFIDEYWWWRYLDNPVGDHFCQCAIYDGRIVGVAGGIPYRIKWGDREIIAGQITDLAVEPELRGKKVFSAIQKANMAEIKKKANGAYGFTNEITFPIYGAYDYAFRVPRMTKVLNTRALLKNRDSLTTTQKITTAIGNIGLSIIERMKKKRIKSHLSIKTITSFDSSFDTFFEIISPLFKMMHVRNHKYLNWRYCANPFYRYTTYVVEKEGDILGFVVLRNKSGREKRGFILEFFAVQGREDVQHLLLNKITEHFRQRGVDMITCWLFPHSPYYNTFRQHLYMKRKGDLIVVFTGGEQDQDTVNSEELKKDFTNPLNWHISCGDHDAF